MRRKGPLLMNLHSKHYRESDHSQAVGEMCIDSVCRSALNLFKPDEPVGKECLG